MAKSEKKECEEEKLPVATIGKKQRAEAVMEFCEGEGWSKEEQFQATRYALHLMDKEGFPHTKRPKKGEKA